MEHSGVLGEGFQIVALPAAIEIARFLQKQARAREGGGAAFVEFRFILHNAGKKSVKFTSHIQQRES
jgi:hypothetical protein